MQMNTTEMRGTEAMRAIFCIDAARCNKLKITSEFYSVKFKERALLVEPVNGSPYVLIDNTADRSPDTISLPMVQRVEFVPDEKSGTDKMRARMEAGMFFERLPTRPLPAVPTGELIIQQMREVVSKDEQEAADLPSP